MTIRDDLPFYVQLAAGLAIGPILLARYWAFRRELYSFVVAHLGLTAILALVYLLVFAQVGTGFGVQYEIWDEDFLGRALSAHGATLLLGVLGVISFYLDRFPWHTDQKTAAWLRPDEALRRRVELLWGRWLPRLTPTPRPSPESDPEPTFWDRARFAFNTLIDPVSITPLQAWLEPRQENSIHLQRFLRTVRTPFLLLLLAPAALPRFFAQVPRVAPGRGLGLGEAYATLDVTQDPAGYALGVAAWLLGIVAGVLVIKVLIRLSDFLHPRSHWDPASEPVRAPLDGLPAWVTANRHCPNFGLPGGCPGHGCPRGVPVESAEQPTNCGSTRKLQSSTRVFALIFLVVYAGMGLTHHLVEYLDESGRLPAFLRSTGAEDSGLIGLLRGNFPGFAIFALLAVVAMLCGIAAYLPRRIRLPLSVACLLWLGWANNDPFKLRFEGFSPGAYSKSERIDLRKRLDEVYFPDTRDDDAATPPGLVADDEALENWSARAKKEGGVDLIEGRPKLVLVAVSGGASRSAYWTAVVLDRLERSLPGFGRRVRIISGASGGMLGTAYYVTYRRDVAEEKVPEPKGDGTPCVSEPTAPSAWVESLPVGALDDVASYIALREPWKALWPGSLSEDRGIVLEKYWKELRRPFAELADLERAGRVPSLIFSPMMVDDGRRLLISNLDLFRDPNCAAPPMVLTEGAQVGYSNPESENAVGIEDRPFSLSGMEFYRLFPASGRGLMLSTAVRMSASFPFVSPAVNLPTNPPRRVVDAGYYDNYGIQVATAWVKQNRAWLMENTSGVLLVQVRDSSSVIDRLDVNDAPPSPWDVAARGFQFLTSPIDGLIEARYTTASFRNDSEVLVLHDAVRDAMKAKLHDPNAFFATVIFENSADVTLKDEDFWKELDQLQDEDRKLARPYRHDPPSDVSMTWNLTYAERAATRRGIPDDPKATAWRAPGARQSMRDTLANQVFTSPTDAQKAMDEQDRFAAAHKGLVCFPPGPERNLRLKRLEQLRNYERVQNLKVWWTKAGARTPNGGTVAGSAAR